MTGVCSDDDDDGKAAVKATRTKAEPEKDWDAVADTAESLTDLDDLKALWKAENVGRAPKVIQDRVKAAGEALKASDEPA